MPTIHEAIEGAIAEVMEARKRVAGIKTKQIRRDEDIAKLNEVATKWFQIHKPIVATAGAAVDLPSIDKHFVALITATAKHAAKKTYLDVLHGAKAALIAARSAALVAPAAAPLANTDDLAPDFSPLAGNPEMRDILTRRWHECAKCVKADAHLAAIVMMGGLLEALFVARANKMTDKILLTGAANAPKDKATGKTTNYQEWMLDSYIKVGCELKWITESAKDVADKLKEYRNFVHPAKELRYGVTLGFNDSSMFWQVTKALARQLLLSA